MLCPTREEKIGAGDTLASTQGHCSIEYMLINCCLNNGIFSCDSNSKN